MVENVFYENDVTQEDRDRIAYLDDTESMGKLMFSKRHYGYAID